MLVRRACRVSRLLRVRGRIQDWLVCMFHRELSKVLKIGIWKYLEYLAMFVP